MLLLNSLRKALINKMGFQVAPGSTSCYFTALIWILGVVHSPFLVQDVMRALFVSVTIDKYTIMYISGFVFLWVTNRTTSSIEVSYIRWLLFGLGFVPLVWLSCALLRIATIRRTPSGLNRD